MVNNCENTKNVVLYQVIESYWSGDEYERSKDRVLRTFADEAKARSFLEEIVKTHKIKKEALNEAGVRGYFNKFENYQYFMRVIQAD